jgi:tetratricopeptide (TPR) repeat protein
MRHLSACLAVLVVFTVAAADEANLKEARERWLHGNYEEARELFEEVAKDAKDAKQRVLAALGISRCHESVGEYDKALAAIDTALKDNAKNPDLLARRAELLYLRGKWDDAEKAADQAIALDKDHFLARWVQSQIYRDRGELKKADAGFRWFVRMYNLRADKDKEISDPDELLLVGLAGAENARWNKLSDQFEFVLQDVYNEAFKKDKNFWPAKYQAGALLIEKYNRADGLPALEKALAINPHAAEVYVAKGQAALQKFEAKDAEQFAERALKINPNLVEARHLRADIYWMGGTLTKAMAELEAARKVNPRDEATLGRIAACMILERNQAGLTKLVAEVDGFDAKPGNFYYVLAERLEERRHFDDAEKYYKKSIELRPMVPWARNSLGMLYMRMGREAEAKPILTDAFDADEFNVRIDNTLKVLRHLENYKTEKTEHFILRFDADQDAYLGQLMGRYLEETYEKLATKFQYRPKGPFVVEVFNNHEMFSGRVIAVPDLHTIGACTGRMVAMVSPRGAGIRKPFNWGRVLRHELVHIFNLEQTHFLIPHWYTEGLAVISEGYPRPQPWNQLLLEKVPKGDLLNLDTIDLGFIRPRSPVEWHQAYCQSQLYVEFMTDTYGKQTVGELLAAYGEGMDTEAALKKVCKVDKATFEKGYRKYLDGVVSKLRGKPAEKELTFREAREKHDEDPTNNDVAARLAELYLQRDKKQARELADQVLKRKPGHPLASYVKARLLRGAGEDDEALKLLEGALKDPKAFEPKAAELLGKIYFDAAKFDKAAEVYERARAAEPLESKWIAELVRVYAQNGDKEKHVKLLIELAPTDADDLDVRKQLAKMLLEVGNAADAERYAREALEIDCLDADAETYMGDALARQKKYVGAIEAYQVAIASRERERAIEKADDVRLRLARAFQGKGDKQSALNEVTKVLAHDENNAKAKELKLQLEKQ